MSRVEGSRYSRPDGAHGLWEIVRSRPNRAVAGPRKVKRKEVRRPDSEVVVRGVLAARARLAFVVLTFARGLLDHFLLHDGLRSGWLANYAARNPFCPARGPGLSARTVRGRLTGRRLRGWASAGASRLDRGGHAAAPAAARRPGRLTHERAALVADGGRHGVEGATGRARLRAHFAHLLFLAEPILEGHEGGLLAPPLLELAIGQRTAELPGCFLLELRDDLVVLEAHLLLVVGHLDLARRELDAALGALFHVDRDPGLAVRALRHVLLELDAALRARRRVLGDEGAALAALDHLARAVDLPAQRDADHRRGGCREDDEEQPVGQAKDWHGLIQERHVLLDRDALRAGRDRPGRRGDDDVVGSVLRVGRDNDRPDEQALVSGDRLVRRDDGRAGTQLDRHRDAHDGRVRPGRPHESRHNDFLPGFHRLARGGGRTRDVAVRRRRDIQGAAGEAVALVGGSTSV